MKRRLLAPVAVAAFALTSCVGGFNLTRSLHGWNTDIENRWGRWGVFVAFVIIPVYPVCLIADALVINSVEFWSGENPITVAADGKSHRTLRAHGEQAHLTYDLATGTLRIDHDGQTVEMRPLDERRVEVRRAGRVEVWQVERDRDGVRLFGPSGEARIDGTTLARIDQRLAARP